MTDAPTPGHLDETRAFYDAIAEPYADRYRDILDDTPHDQQVLATFADHVHAAHAGSGSRDGSAPRVADVGSGPGQVTAYLHGLGLDVTGVDLSPRMAALAARTFPHVPFTVGTLTALDIADGALAGLCAWYSTIHLPDDELPAAFAEFHRVLAPGGHALVAFQAGDVPLRLAEPFGKPVTLDFRRRDPDHVARLLDAAGLTVHSHEVRLHDSDLVSAVPQAYLIARKSS
ncbi:class I SAM-dependent DNA methyltransferase [Yinghuangia seranimata]|uniref:class I SAM-dependent DNA methyltransferase n=1 Tax=Yinghuangia seranimata TaxID=408067 RepID=UPI00248B5624|nr:class I SAM-dependent methyltransferase [Yinghuangia seranimata]MDI2129154.1 methyltransferase domain-containing protein [Yinghuangia seranimata]